MKIFKDINFFINIALDTLSDGKYFIDKYKGIILSSTAHVKLNKSKSISYVMLKMIMD